jgi:hypothetical protein
MSSPLIAITEKSTCSFCNRNCDKLAVKSTKTGQVICHDCLHDIQVSLGVVPEGCLRCLKCGSYERIDVIYSDSTVSFRYTGQDAEDMAIYVPVLVRGTWDRPTSRFDSAICGKCAAVIPFSLIWENHYVLPRKDAYEEDDDDENDY